MLKYDAKLKGVRSREAAVDKNGELVTRSVVRRERMGHIASLRLSHIWFMRGAPKCHGAVDGVPVRQLERGRVFCQLSHTRGQRPTRRDVG